MSGAAVTSAFSPLDVLMRTIFSASRPNRLPPGIAMQGYITAIQNSTASRSSPFVAAVELVDLLLCEFWQSFLHIHPRLLALHKASNCCTYRVLVRSNLFRTITISKGERVILDRLEVYCDAERCTKLVISRIAFANAC